MTVDPNTGSVFPEDLSTFRRTTDSPYRIGAFFTTLTRAIDSTGNQVVSGVGFRPAVIYVIAKDDNAASVNSNGWSDGPNSQCTVMRVTALDASFTNCIDVSDGINGWQASVASLDADGFTLAWSKVGQGKAITMKIIAVK